MSKQDVLFSLGFILLAIGLYLYNPIIALIICGSLLMLLSLTAAYFTGPTNEGK